MTWMLTSTPARLEAQQTFRGRQWLLTKPKLPRFVVIAAFNERDMTTQTNKGNIKSFISVPVDIHLENGMEEGIQSLREIVVCDCY